MVPAGNKANHLSLVNHTTKTIHHHHHHHHHAWRARMLFELGILQTIDCVNVYFFQGGVNEKVVQLNLCNTFYILYLINFYLPNDS